MKEFKFNSATMQILLEQTAEDFVKNFNQMFYLNGEALKLLLKYLPNKEALIEFLKTAQISPTGSTAEIFPVLHTQYSEAEIAILFAQSGHIDWVMQQDLEDLLIRKRLFLDEICLYNKNIGWINDKIYRENPSRSILIKNQDWKTLAFYDEAEILFRYERYDDMLRGAQKCYDLLYHSIHRSLITKNMENLREKSFTYFNPYLFLAQQKDSTHFFAEGNLWLQLKKLYETHQIKAEECFETCVLIAFYKESIEAKEPELIKFIASFVTDQNLTYRPSELKQKAFEIWLYHQLREIGEPRLAKKTLKKYSLFSSQRKRIKEKRKAINYDSICASLKYS